MQEAQRQRADENRHQRHRQVALRVVKQRHDLIPDQHAGSGSAGRGAKSQRWNEL